MLSLGITKMRLPKLVLAVSCALIVCSTSKMVADDSCCPNPGTENNAEKTKPTKEELFAPSFIQKISLTYGHLIQKSLNNPVIKMDSASVIQGIKDAEASKPAPLTDKEYEEAIGLIQQYAFEDMAQNNLKEAEAFLEKNANEPQMTVLDNGKVQYTTTQEGSGEILTEEMVPTIHYTATYSNGTKLGSSEQQGGPIAVPLNDTIPGFRTGVLGMKVGEKRRIFVHPELGYGATGPLPNGLLIFDIELVSMAEKPANDDSPMDQDEDEDDDDSISDSDDDDSDEEDEDDEDDK